MNRHEVPIIQGSQVGSDTAGSRLTREAAIFSGIDNQRVRDTSWSAIPYFNKRILQEIDLRKDTENALDGTFLRYSIDPCLRRHDGRIPIPKERWCRPY